MYRLVNKTGLISKKMGHYTLSNYGKVVYHSLNIINRGSESFWALKAMDNNEMSSAVTHRADVGNKCKDRRTANTS
jgi:hypothetical protein